MVEATAAKNFRNHDAMVLERKPIDEVNHIEDSLVFAKRYFMFSTEYAVNEDVNAIARKFDDRIAMSDLRWNGVSVCLVDDFGEAIDAHLIANAGRRKHRRALGDSKLARDSLVWLFVSDATNPTSFRMIQ
jgi:hypothetical protein